MTEYSRLEKDALRSFLTEAKAVHVAHFQVLPSSDRRDESDAPLEVVRFRRVKAIVAVLLVTSALIGFLLAAFFLASVFAAFLVILVAVVSTFAFIKAAVRRVGFR